MTTVNGEKAQESGPSGAPAKKPLPFKRGVRRGDVLLMVAKLDPDSAKPEQRTQPQDTPCLQDPSPSHRPWRGKEGGGPTGPSWPPGQTCGHSPEG